MKKAWILLFALTIVAMAFADTVQVGSATDNSQYLPIYGSYSYSYSQQIFSQAQISKAGSISKLRLYRAYGSIASSKDWVIYMGHTSKSRFGSLTDWAALSSLTQVFAGDISSMVPLENNWMEITLTTPFNYNNINNLIIAVDENTPYFESMSWGAFSVGAAAGIYYHSNSTNPNPAAPPTASNRTSLINTIQFVFPNTAAPLAPTLLSPANGGWNFIDGRLDWRADLSGSDPDSYDVYFGSSTSPPLVSENQIGTSFSPTLAPNTRYYWKVVARNEHGDSPASATRRFKTGGDGQLAQSFEEASFPPLGWACPEEWFRRSDFAKHGANSAITVGYPDTLAVLSSPKVSITASSTFDLWTLANKSSATMQVLYSTDRENWTQIGSDISYAAPNTWYNIVTDLSSLAGQNCYLGIRKSGLEFSWYYVDMVFGPNLALEVPGAVDLVLPADLAENVNELTTFTWTDPYTDGIPTAYKVYCDQSPDPTTLRGTTSGLSYTLSTPLAYSTTYYWKVVATNAIGDGSASTIHHFSTVPDPIIYSYPYIENFDSVIAPALPRNWGLSTGSAQAFWQWESTTADADHGADAAYSGTNFAYLNCFAAEDAYNPYCLISPPLALDAIPKRLNYFYWIGADTVNQPLMIDVSTDMMNWTTLYTHSNASNTLAWFSNTIDLSAYASTTVHLRFRGMSNYGYTSTNLGLDDVMVENIPTVPILSYSPSSIDFGNVPYNTATDFTNVVVRNTGAGTLYLNASSISLMGRNADQFNFTNTALPAALTAGQSLNIPVRFVPTAIGRKTASLRISYNAANYDVALSGTMLGLPLSEGFEGSTFPPAGWSIYNGGASNTWTRFPAPYPRTGEYAVGISYNAATAHNDWLITPALGVRTNASSFSFWAKNRSSNFHDQFNVKLSTTTNTISAFSTTLANAVTPGTTYTQYSYDLSAYIGQNVYIAIQAISLDQYYLFLDDFTAPPIYTAPIYPDNAVSIPHLQTFDAASIPIGWTQGYAGLISSNRWSLSNTAFSGGTAHEMKAESTARSGISRLISPPIITADLSAIQVSFKHYFDDFDAGLTAKLQYSYDLITWMDSPWSLASGAGDASGNPSLLITDIYAPVTYLAWSLQGNHYLFESWYIDDVDICLPPAHEVGIQSLNLPFVVNPAVFTPQATVINNGLSTETFTVTLNIGSQYSNIQSVIALASGASTLVSFASFTPTVDTEYPVTATTLLATDQNAANNTMQSALICIDLDITAYADVAYDPTHVLNGPATFNLQNPGSITDLPEQPNALCTNNMGGADWIAGNNGWYASNYDPFANTTPFWHIDAVSGLMVQSGSTPSGDYQGIAYDAINSVWYAAKNTELYAFDPIAGTHSLVGSYGGASGWFGTMSGIAHDNTTGQLYGLDVRLDALYSIDKSSGEATLIGYLGVDLSHAEGISMDQNTGYLYAAGYDMGIGGVLYWINTSTGSAWKIGDFQGNAFLTAFTIPHGQTSGLDSPELSIAADGSLGWNAIAGADFYTIYGSIDPHLSVFPTLATTTNLTWLDPNFPNAQSFYRVSASTNTNRSRARRPTFKSAAPDQSFIKPLSKPTNTKTAKELRTKEFPG